MMRERVNVMIEDDLKKQEHMTPVEKKIAAYFIDHGDDIQGQSAHTIAKELYTHPSMITRFCQKMGFQGYSDFRKSYVAEKSYQQTHFIAIDPNFPFGSQDKNIVVANKIGQLYHEIIDDTLSLVKHDDLQKMIDLIAKAKTIYVYSAGVQASLAQTFKDKMIRIGKNVVVEQYMNELFYRASFCHQNSLFMIISYTGEIEAELRGVRKLKERHVPVVAITTYGHNTLSKLADHVMYVSTREKIIENLGDFAMNLSTLLLLDVLYVNTFNLHFDQHYENKIISSKEFELHRKSENTLIK